MTRRRKVWTPQDVRDLGVRTTVEIAGDILGLSRTQAYEAIRRSDFPVPVIRVGRRMVVPTAALLELLGLGAPDAQAGEITMLKKREAG